MLAVLLSVSGPPGAALADVRVRDHVRSLGPGVRLHEMELFRATGWVRSFVLEVDLDDPDVRTDVIGTDTLSSAKPLSEIAADAGAVAAVNADFYDINGTQVAVGTEMRSGSLRKTGSKDRLRSLVQTEAGNVSVASPAVDASITYPWSDRTPDALRYVNVSRLEKTTNARNSVVLFTPVWGAANRRIVYAGSTEPAAPADVVEVAVGPDGRVVDVVDGDPGRAEIPAGGFLLGGRDGGATTLRRLAVGDPVSYSAGLKAVDGSQPEWVVGVKDVLVQNGALVAGLNTVTPDPRTAAGSSQDRRTLFLLVADGRSPAYAGLTMSEQGRFLLEAGAWQAATFDSGGSSEMVARLPGDRAPQVVNTPSDGHERPMPNAIGIFTTPGEDRVDSVAIRPQGARSGGERVFPGLHRTLRAVPLDDHLVPRSDEISSWSVDGGGSIDASGRLTAPTEGNVDLAVRADAGGTTGDADVRVLGEPVELTSTRSKITLAGAGAEPLELAIRGHDAEGFAAPIEFDDLRLAYDADVARVTESETGDLLVHPVADGATVLRVSVAGVDLHLPLTVGFDHVTVSGFETDGEWQFFNERAPNGTMELVDSGRTGKGARVDYDLTETTAIRTSGVAPVGGPITLPGQPLRIRYWIDGDAKGSWTSATIVDAEGKSTNLYGQYLTTAGWQPVDIDIPSSGIAYPIRLKHLRIIETDASKQYAGTVTFDDLGVDVPADVEVPSDPPVQQDRIVSPDGRLARGGGRWTFGAISDIQFTAADPFFAPVAPAALKRIRRTEPDFIVLNGDIVDTGFQEDFDLAREKLAEGGCDLIAVGEEPPADHTPDPSAGSIPCYYVAGNHESYGTDSLANFTSNFGRPWRTFDHKGVRFVLLASALGSLRSTDFDQVAMFASTLEEAAEDPSVASVMVFAHHPTNDPDPAGASQLGERREVSWIEESLASFRAETGKGAAMFGSHAQIVNVNRVDGVPYMVLPSSGKNPYGTPARGGFTGWVRFGMDPGEDAGGDWLRADVRAFAQSISLDAPETLRPGASAAVEGSIVQPLGIDPGTRVVPLRYPMSVHWSGSDALAIGQGASAIDAARADGKVAILDPRTRRLTALREGEVTIAVENDSMRAGDDLSPIRAEARVRVAKVDPPKDDPPRVDPPTDDPPVVDPPKDDPPVVDPPKDDPPVVDPPKVDPPGAARSVRPRLFGRSRATVGRGKVVVGTVACGSRPCRATITSAKLRLRGERRWRRVKATVAPRLRAGARGDVRLSLSRSAIRGLRQAGSGVARITVATIADGSTYRVTINVKLRARR